MDDLETLQRWLRPGTYTILEVGIRSEVDGAAASTTVSLSVLREDGARLALLLRRARNIELKLGPYDRIQTPGLFVEDVSGDQIEAVRYRVRSEADVTGFDVRCAEIEVVTREV